MVALRSSLFRRPRVDAPSWIEVVELQRRLAASETVVVVDVRQHEEFTARPGRNRRAGVVKLNNRSEKSTRD
jgi:hypothetical protein